MHLGTLHYDPEYDAQIVLKLLTKSDGPIPESKLIRLLKTGTNLSVGRIAKALKNIGARTVQIDNINYITL